MSNIMVKSYCE